MKILIMGLPGAGKTWLAERLTTYIDDCAWFNADVIRSAANDWDFSTEGRVRQAKRMRTFADFENSQGRHVICDFVAPTIETRQEFDAGIIVWLDTIREGRYDDTNKLFQDPVDEAHVIIKHHFTEEETAAWAELLKKRLK